METPRNKPAQKQAFLNEVDDELTAACYPRKTEPRNWRTRKDPFVEVWDSEIIPLLKKTPELAPTTLFEDLQDRHPGRFPNKQTLSVHDVFTTLSSIKDFSTQTITQTGQSARICENALSHEIKLKELIAHFKL